MQRKKKTPSNKTPPLYELYEQSVQSPQTHINWLVDMYHQLNGEYPVHLREDFCGTFAMSCAWVKRNRNNTAIGLDLDSEPIHYGKRVHLARLTPDQKKRIKILRKNAISVTTPKADVIMAGNFSFFIFKERKTLVEYLKKCRLSLKKKGFCFLEMAGGPGMIAQMKETKRIKPDDDSPRTYKKTFTYIWDQKSYNPINHNGHYAIHFKLPGKKLIEDAFTYDWRIWTLPEVSDAMKEAGFSKVVVFWETEHKGKGTGEYLPATEGDNAYSWIAYAVGVV
jgi:hypothetical protein